MGQLIKAIANVLKKLSYSAFLTMFFVIGFQLGIMFFQHNIETGDNFYEWVNMEKECNNEIVIVGVQSIEYTCDERIVDYNKLKFYVRIEVYLVLLMAILDYIMNPKDHYFTKIKEMIKCTE